MTPFCQGLAKTPDVRFPELPQKFCFFFFLFSQPHFLYLGKVFLYTTVSPSTEKSENLNLKTAISAKGEALPLLRRPWKANP